MTKRLKSKHKVDRRLKANLWGRPKSPFNSRAYPPGQHGQNKKGKPTDYGTQLQAKQKLKAYYGNINERQFRNIYRKALAKRGDTTENLVGSSNKNLVYYSMDGCPHCKKFDETWAQLKEKNSTKIGLRKVDSKSCGGECQNNNVQGFPTILLCDSSNSKIKECPTRDLDGILKFLQENE